jgi:hypothetical protein
MNIGQVHLFAADVLEKDTFIIEYVGPRISNKEVSRRGNTRYLFETNSCWTIDGSPLRNTASHINYACRPKPIGCKCLACRSRPVRAAGC